MRTTLTAFVPAHKQTNPEHKPGQVVFSPEPGPNTAINPLGFVDKTLGDYIRRKDGIDKAFEAVAAEKKKLTFDEWINNPYNWRMGDNQYDDLLALWNAAQENV